MVVVVGVSLVVDGAVLVSGAVDDGGLLVGAWVSLTPDDVAGAGVVLTLGVGVLGALPEVCRMAIRIPATMASTASAVPIATAKGRRYQASLLAPVMTGSGPRSRRGRARSGATAPLPGSSSYSPGRIGMIPESSPASDQASAGAEADSSGMSATVIASSADPAAVGASAVSLSPGPRAARSAAPTAAVRCGRGAVTTSAPDCSDNVLVTKGILAPPPTDAIAAKSSGRIPLRSSTSCKKSTKPCSG